MHAASLFVGGGTQVGIEFGRKPQRHSHTVTVSSVTVLMAYLACGMATRHLRHGG